jgi:hypothetical protein
LVNAGNPPTRLAVEQQNLEEHFLQLTDGTSLQAGDRERSDLPTNKEIES